MLQLYCNTLQDGHGTPWHYEWIDVVGEASSGEGAGGDNGAGAECVAFTPSNGSGAASSGGPAASD